MTGDPHRSVLEPDRWNLNLVAVGVVVAVVLAAIVAWMLTGDGDEESGGGPASATPTPVAPTEPTSTPSPSSAPPQTPPPTTSAQPMPAITTSTAPPAAIAPAATVPVTAAPGAGPGAVAGDLGVAGHPMQRPPCDGAYITILASGLGRDVSAAGLAALLGQYPGSEYLRTDQTCPSLNQSSDGQPIYVVYFGPFAVDTDACQARASGSADAYVRRLATDPGGGSVSCGG